MINTPSMQELLEAGVHFGHQVRRGNPRMAQYIFGAREGVHIVDLEQSEKLLKEAAQAAYNLGKEGKVLLFIGTKKQAQPIVREAAEAAGAPFINFRWMGGTLTNFDEIRKNIKKLLDLKDKREKGELGHYTKKEQLLISRKLERFDKEYGGVATLDHLPDAVFIVDCVAEKTALTEANRLGLTILAVVDSNANPDLVNYPIPGNDDAVKSIKILVDTIAQAYGQGKKAIGEDSIKNPESNEKVEVKEKRAKRAKKVNKSDETVEEKALDEEVAVIEEKVEQAEVKEAGKEV